MKLDDNEIKFSNGTVAVRIETQANFKMVFEEIKYAVKTKQILKDISGSVNSGQIVAILGSSGAGKSSFLNVVAGRIESGSIIGGQITINGYERSNSWVTHCAFVKQEDVFHEELTVSETLSFAADFRLSHVTTLEKVKIVDELIFDLGLDGCRSTRIGGFNEKGISGGERKRLSVGVELLSSPKLLLLDEPTTGLDAFTAFNTVSLIKKVVQKRNIAVLMTIHQPRSDILNLIDEIQLISAGLTVFHGSIEDGVNHFSTLGYLLPKATNPADFLVDIIALDQRGVVEKEASEKAIHQFYSNWKSGRPTTPTNRMNTSIDTISTSSTFKLSILQELYHLTRRSWLIQKRERVMLYMLLINSVLVSIFIGCLFYKTTSTPNSFVEAFTRLGLLFALGTEQLFVISLPIIPVFLNAIQMAKIERGGGCYRSISAFIATWIVNIPMAVVSAIIFITPAYWMSRLTQDWQTYIQAVIILCIESVVGISMGILVSCSSSTILISQLVMSLAILMQILFGGVVVLLTVMPEALRWLRYLSIVANSTAAFIQNEFEGKVFECNVPPCFPDGKSVIENFSYDTLSKWEFVLVNVGVMGLFLICGAILFHSRSNPKLKLK